GTLVLGVVSLNLLRSSRLARSASEGGPRWRFGLVVIPALVYLAVRLGVGLALGQSLSSLPEFLHGVLEVASGYVEGMAYPDNPTLRACALADFAVLALALATLGRSLLRERRQQLACVLLLGTVFVMW